MRHVLCCLIISLTFINTKAKEINGLDSLFHNADVVVSGHITSVLGGFSHDLGTEYVWVEIEVDSVFKQNFYIETKPLKFTWIVSNLRCDSIPMLSCVTKYEGKPWIFFLNQSHIYGGAELPESQILPTGSNNIQFVSQLRQNSILQINVYETANQCGNSCGFCHAVEKRKWNKVKRQLETNKNNIAGMIHHRCIKWLLPDRMIQSSLPSWMGVRYRFQTDDWTQDAVATYQVGMYKHYYLFSRERHDIVALTDFQLSTIEDSIIWKFTKEDLRTKLSTNAWISEYGKPIEISDKLAKMISLYEWDFQLYRDYQTMPEYEQYATGYIDTLVKHEKVYSLCIMALHNIPEVAVYGLAEIRALNDKRAIPFMMDMAKTYMGLYANGTLSSHQEIVAAELIRTLDGLLGTKTLEKFYPYGLSTSVLSMSIMYPIWQSRFVDKE